MPNPVDASAKPKSKARTEIKLPFRENVTLPADSGLLKRFGTVKDLLEDRRWAEAIGILQDISQTEHKSLVMVEPGQPGSVQTYLNAATNCNILLSRMPAEGLVIYRQRVDPQAKRWFQNWQKTRDPAELSRILRQGFVSSYGDDALLALGEVEWDRSDYSAARRLWEQIVPLAAGADPDDYKTVLRYPDSDLDLAAVLARLVECSILERDTPRAQDDLRQLKERFPLAEGWVAGQRGRFVELLGRELEASRSWVKQDSTASVSTFGMSAARYQPIHETIDVGSLQWIHPLPKNELPRPSDALPFPSEPLSYHPVVNDKIVFVNDADSIRAWNLLTGDPAWQSERRDPSIVYPAIPDESPPVPDKTCVGVPHYSMTVSGNRLYARMGSAVTCSSTAELRRDLASDLVCLDLEQEGKLKWKMSAQDLLPDEPPWRYEGSPVISGSRAFVAVARRHPQLELMVLCLDAFDGHLLWQRPIGAYRSTVDDSNNRVSHLLLTLGGGRVFLSTDAGAVLALDSQDGRLEWAVAYESRTDESTAALSDPAQKGLLPAMFHAGLLFVAPNDAVAAYCLEADSGRVHWRFPYLQRGARNLSDLSRPDRGGQQLANRQWRQLIGVVPGGPAGRLIVNGSSLWAIDIETGAVAWQRSDSAISRGASGCGLLIGNQILLPTRESIEIYDGQTGEHVRKVALKAADAAQRGGNLVFAEGMLLVAQANQIAAYCEYGQLKERIEHELTLRPNDSKWRIQLAELEMLEKHFDAAEVEFRTVLQSIDRTDPAYFIVRRKLSRLLLDKGTAEVRASKNAEARDHWLQALSLADDITKNVELRIELARLDELLGEPSKAVEQFQQILNDERLASVRRDGSLAGHDASREITRLISKYGEGTYREAESGAVLEFERLAKAGDRHGLRRLIARYPHARITSDARRVLVRLYRESRENSEAFAVLNGIRKSAADDRAAIEVMLDQIEFLEDAGYTLAAANLWQTLRHRPSSMEVRFAGEKADLFRLAESRLEALSAAEGCRPGYLDRTWSASLPADAVIVVPQYSPPSDGCAAVLICTRHSSQSNSWLWQCVDWKTGRIRWQENASGPVRSAAWTPVHLLIGSPQGWYARAAEDGRPIWEQVSFHEAVPSLVGSGTDITGSSVFPALFDTDNGLQLFDPDNGEVLAKVRPEGRLHSIVGTVQSTNVGEGKSPQVNAPRSKADESSASVVNPSESKLIVLMQTLKPVRTWRAEVSLTQQQVNVSEISTGGESWQTPPMMVENRIVGMTRDDRLIGYRPGHVESLSNSLGVAIPVHGVEWEYRNFATGQSEPVPFVCEDKLLAVVDGMRLVAFEPQTGNRKWSSGLSDFPMQSARDGICITGNLVLATSRGLLRAVSTTSGSSQFEQYLGETSPQWRTTIAWQAPQEILFNTTSQSSRLPTTPTCLIAAWPVGVQQKEHVIRICDGNSGALLQQLRMEEQPQGVVISRNGTGVVWSEKTLIGLRFSTVAAGATSMRQ